MVFVPFVLRLSVLPCVHPETLLTQHLAEYFTHSHQNYINDALGERDKCIKFWGQKVTVQGHGGITYAGTIAVQAEAYSTRRLVSS